MSIDNEGPSDKDLGIDPTKDPDYREISDEVWEKISGMHEGVSREQAERRQNAGIHAEAFFAGDWQQTTRNRLMELGQPAEDPEHVAATAAGDFVAAVGVDAQRVPEEDRVLLIGYFKRQKPADDRKAARRQAAGAIGILEKSAGMAAVNIASRGEDHAERSGLRDLLKSARETEQRAERSRKDQAILTVRGEREPVHTKRDVTSFEGLDGLRGEVVKFTRDGGKTWRYGKLGNRGPENFEDAVSGDTVEGYGIRLELMPNQPVDVADSLTASDFEKGMVVRPTKRRETKDMRFSFEGTETA
ncbi:MAG: hypothetical protein WD603_02565 [Patescibacteria group bacterium]